MKNAIVILNYNDLKTTEEMINQIKDYKSLNNIIIVDNCSTDNSYEKLRKFENKKIKVIKTNSNKGYAYGNNFGIKYIIDNLNIDNVIISNPDVIVSDSTILSLAEDLKNNKDITLIAPRVNERGVISRGWKVPTFIDDLLSNINYVQRFAKKRQLYKDEHYSAKLSKVEAVHGCFFMVRLKEFEKIGLFDENTFLYYEENIIGKKMLNNNMGVYVDNEVEVIHNLSVSVDKSFNSIKKYKIIKTSQKYYEKHYNNLNIFGMIILRFVYYISLGVSYVLVFIKNLWRK